VGSPAIDKSSGAGIAFTGDVLSAGQTAIIIDDDEMLGSAIQQAFEREGVAAACFADPPPPEELEKLQPGLLIVDCILKTTSGPDYLLKIQGYDGLANVPVLVMTGIGELADAMAESEYQYEVLRKPFGMQDLLTAARELISNSRARQ
jgi:DNA-binding response OmpR family regulator